MARRESINIHFYKLCCKIAELEAVYELVTAESGDHVAYLQQYSTEHYTLSYCTRTGRAARKEFTSMAAALCYADRRRADMIEGYKLY